MRTIYLIVIALFFTSLSYSQHSAFYDALSIRSSLDKSTQKIQIPRSGSFCTANAADVRCKALELLNQYAAEDVQNTNSQQVYQYYQSNPFIKDYIKQGGSVSGISFLKSTEGGNAKSILNTVAGFNVATYADGLARFLVERTKKELSVAFFEQFKQDLKKIDELRLLFPKTYSLLMAMDQEIYNYSGYINMLRETFQEDLKNIIPNLNHLITQSPAIEEYLDHNPTMALILKNALTIAEALQNGEHPGDVLTMLKKDYKNDTSIQNLSPALAVLDLFSQSLRSKQDDRYWISGDSLRLLFKDDATFKIYLGLLYEQAKKETITFVTNNEPITLDSLLRKMAYGSNKAAIETYIKGLITKAERVNQTLHTIRQMDAGNGTKSTYTEHYAFYSASIAFLEQVAQIDKIPFIKENIKYDGAAVNTYFDIVYSVGDLHLDVREQNYYGAVINLTAVLQKAIPEYIQVHDSARSSKLANEFTYGVLPKMLKYGNLAAALAEADSAAQVQEIIESIALPAGSYSAKRRSKQTFTVNAYVGLTGGGGYNTASEEWGGESGIFAPVGLEYCWGLDRYRKGKIFKERPSFSVFVPLIDLGAITSYRFGSDSNDELPEISLDDIIAPGVFLVLGSKRNPISFGIGGQMFPSLYNVTDDNVQTTDGVTFGVRGFIAVDLPLLNIYNKPKNYSSKKVHNAKSKKQKLEQKIQKLEQKAKALND